MSATTVVASSDRTQQLGFSSLDQEVVVGELPQRGEMPPWLTGSLLRTGPADVRGGKGFASGHRAGKQWSS